MTLKEKITERQYRTWTRAFDSLTGQFINIRRLERDSHTQWNDGWLIKETLQRLHSSRGCLPLYITIL